jgi:hypothetical protein
LLGQDRGSWLLAAVAQALALQAMQFSVIAIPEAPPKILGSAATRVGRNEVERRISIVENPALRCYTGFR